MCTMIYKFCEFCKVVNPDIDSISECENYEGDYDFTHCPSLLVQVTESYCQWCLDHGYC